MMGDLIVIANIVTLRIGQKSRKFICLSNWDMELHLFLSRVMISIPVLLILMCFNKVISDN